MLRIFGDGVALGSGQVPSWIRTFHIGAEASIRQSFRQRVFIYKEDQGGTGIQPSPNPKV